MGIFRPLARALVLLPMLLPAACATPPAQGIGSPVKTADENLAEAGNADAQYRMGASVMAGGAHLSGASGDNRQASEDRQAATKWLCKAARRDHADAQYALGQIYAGHAGGVFQAVGSKVDLSEALLWYRIGGVYGNVASGMAADRLAATLGHNELLKSGLLQSAYPNVPCEWNEVFPDHQANEASRVIR